MRGWDGVRQTRMGMDRVTSLPLGTVAGRKQLAGVHGHTQQEGEEPLRLIKDSTGQDGDSSGAPGTAVTGKVSVSSRHLPFV